MFVCVQRMVCVFLQHSLHKSLSLHYSAIQLVLVVGVCQGYTQFSCCYRKFTFQWSIGVVYHLGYCNNFQCFLPILLKFVTLALFCHSAVHCVLLIDIPGLGNLWIFFRSLQIYLLNIIQVGLSYLRCCQTFFRLCSFCNCTLHTVLKPCGWIDGKVYTGCSKLHSRL